MTRNAGLNGPSGFCYFVANPQRSIDVKYCCQCGAPVALRIPPGDNLPRYVCDDCGNIHYQNPKIVAGCIAEWQGEILLCRRAIEPRLGLWTLPAGFMENGETTQHAAARETLEEARAEVVDLKLYGLFNLPHISQVYIMFRGCLRDGQFSAGVESLEAALFKEEAIPWEELAFPVVRETLRLFCRDRRAGAFPMHTGDIIRGLDRTLETRMD
jgi:ADP-ribose pyrophosphatase YjhB (NUDIX family)